MLSSDDLCGLIHKGGVFGVEGTTLKAVYSDIVEKINLPPGLGRRALYEELLLRERVLSTAVGDGVAIPHPQKQLLTDAAEQRMAVCFLGEPLDMKALDTLKVRVMFVPLTANSSYHLRLLSSIALLVRNTEFRRVLRSQPSEEELLEAVKKCCNN